jgi:predicted ATPase
MRRQLTSRAAAAAPRAAPPRAAARVRSAAARALSSHRHAHAAQHDSAPWSQTQQQQQQQQHGAQQQEDVLGADLAFPAGLAPSQGYAHLVAAGKLKRDEHQAAALASLDSLYRELVRKCGAAAAGGAPPRPPAAAAPAAAPPSSGLFGAMFASLSSVRGAQPAASAGPAAPGLYLWGGTGCGKTMLMDVFYRALPGAAVPKLRVHFHAFMLGVHARLHALRQGGHRGDPLVALADEIAASRGGGRGPLVVCFDELQVTDVGDALIMRRLFDGLWARGVVVVATSNRAPTELYAAGLQRELFVPFITQLLARSAVLALASPTDYRKLAGGAVGAGGGGVWLCPETVGGADGAAAVNVAFQAAWDAAVRGSELQSLTLAAQGRAVPVRCASPSARAARFSFAELCGAPLYSADYQALARSFRTLFLEHVPCLTLSERNEVRRFITLVDTLYEHRVRLVVAAAAPPLRLFSPVWREAAAPAAGPAPAAPPPSTSSYDEAFAFDRTVSRLLEMQSAGYQAGEWRPHVSGGAGASGDLEGGGAGWAHDQRRTQVVDREQP